MLIALWQAPFVRPVSAAETGEAASAKKLPAPTINVNVTEWVVFVADVANPELNARNLFHDSLPHFAEDLRAAASTEEGHTSEPGPIGLIRVSADGPIDKDASLDVQLEFKESLRVLGHWPRGEGPLGRSALAELEPVAADGRIAENAGGIVACAASRRRLVAACRGDSRIVSAL